MDFSSDNSKYSVFRTVTDKTVEENVDVQLNLPEYCSDVRKILKCFVLPNIFAFGISGDRATADAEALIRVLYIGDDGKPECYEQSVSFSKHIDTENTDGTSCLRTQARTEYVNCRAVSQRRISVSASVSIRFVIRKIEGKSLFSPDENMNVQTRGETVSCTVPVAMSEKMFEMSETAALAENLAPASAIVKTHTYSLVDTVKTVQDKMLIKGDMVTDILYCTDSEKGTMEKFRHSMPVSQIIDLDGIDENALCNVNIGISSVCVSCKADSEGKNRLLDISVKAVASVEAYKNCDIDIVEDGYSTDYETDSEYKNMSLYKLLFNYKETKQVRAELDTAGLGIEEITDVFPLSCTGRAEQSGDEISGKGEMTAGILFRNTEGEYGYTEKTADFTFECRGTADGGKMCTVPYFTVTDISAVNVSQNTGEIRMNVCVSMPVFEEKEKRVCTSLKVQEEKSKQKDDCPLTVYFSEKGEKIWDIAKKYNTTTEKIKEDNDITWDEAENKAMLLISAV